MEGGGSIGARAIFDEGADLPRLLALTDGVFAFSLTLLVLYLTVPTAQTLGSLAPGQGLNAELGAYLTNERAAFFAYALAFFIVGSWWSAHRRVFRLLAQINRSVSTMNLVFLVFIAVTPFDVGLLADYGGSAVAVGFYAGTQALAGFSLLGLWLYLGRGGHGLLRAGVEEDVVRAGTRFAWVAPLGFAVSIPLALIDPVVAIGAWIVIAAGRVAVSRWPRPVAPPRPKP